MKLYCVIEEKLSIKLAYTSLKPTDRESAIVIAWEKALLEMDVTLTLGGVSSEQTLFGQLQPDSIVQTAEQPSPFRLLPSSQRSVIMM